jgi:glycosyltransferase involved in cell wall biosynthesis
MTSTAADQLTISVVICAYTEERWADLCAAIDSIRRQTIPPLETILVLDPVPDLLTRARAELSDITIVENTAKQGLSSARNTGVSVARGSVIAFLDDDAVAAPDWLERLAESYAQPDVIGVGGHIEPLWLAARPAWFPDEFGWVVGCAYTGLPEQTAPVRNLIGANMSFRRTAIDSLGGFRTEIGRVGTQMLHCEDTEFSIRVRQRWPGSTLLHTPAAVVHHRVPGHRLRWRYFRDRCFTEGQAKARVARLVGSQDALSSERAYVARVLPRATARAVADTLTGRDVSGLQRAAAIVAGLVLTAAGYLAENTRWPARVSSAPHAASA